MPNVQGLPATIPEAVVARELDRLGVYYEFQSQTLGYHGEKGSTTSDFVIPYYGLIISIIGVYWHGSSSSKAKDMLQKILLARQGYIIIYITDEQTARNASYYVKQALNGNDLSGWSFN
jgi:G:T-mismatch repair DNA endonuclease (very short patch repair protein)